MVKMKNSFGHYVLSADKGMTLTNGEIHTKIYISSGDIEESHWTEVEDSTVPADDELTDTEALEILLGGAV